MYLAINGVEIARYPIRFEVKVMDLDDAETTTRTADGQLSRDRIRAAVRQITMGFNPMRWEDVTAIQQAMTDESFEFTYPDPHSGQQETKTFYVGDRATAVAIERNGTYWWEGLQFTLTEF